ncbi:unnamed protein product [Fraxinus pennsylvanica]|uniref:Uncharacterized protein n=1 Tax=Fraxinus pennsylvanica TaxID=56036 RepID=A0AAD1YUK8_9LAMI|nr:unnamed protein product [Fraxinus pennsylvanica]
MVRNGPSLGTSLQRLRAGPGRGWCIVGCVWEGVFGGDSASQKNRRSNKFSTMERDFFDTAPCSSIAVDSVIRMGTVSVIWGSCVGPFDANKLGFTGIARVSFVAKSVGQYGLKWGYFAAIFSFTHCGIQRYRGKKDWVNVGAAFATGTQNWKQVAGVVCTLYHFADSSRSV